MDPFDEFEFKPLTEGLGFHKKKSDPPAVELSPEFEPLIKDQGLTLLDETILDPLQSPLPRKKTKGFEKTDVVESTAVDQILKTLENNKRLDFSLGKETLKKTTPATSEYKVSTWDFSASFLDTMLVTAASLLCLIVVLLVTHADLVGNLTHPDADGMIYLATATLFLGVSFIYYVVNRAYMGSTPGEWAFDQRIGKPEDMSQVSYIPRVAQRPGELIWWPQYL